jgi:alpha-L-rhamnosidase
VSPNGRVSSNTQTAYVLALHFDLLPETVRAQAAQRLVDNIRQYGNHLTTGFLGTPYLCHVLSRFGHADAAFTLLMQESYPSWLYPVKMGATTIWERWNGIRTDGSFEVPSMNSFNHYAYGAIGDWMYRAVAGLDTDETGPGYRHVVVKPHVGGGLTMANATLDTYYGKTSSGWEWKDGILRLSVTVPPNSKATLHLPVSSADRLTEGGRAVAGSKEFGMGGLLDGRLTLTCGSGSYVFEMPYAYPTSKKGGG